MDDIQTMVYDQNVWAEKDNICIFAITIIRQDPAQEKELEELFIAIKKADTWKQVFDLCIQIYYRCNGSAYPFHIGLLRYVLKPLYAFASFYVEKEKRT